MEYFPYGDLDKYITAGFTEADTKIITTQLLEGLEIMHANDFAHRDLKPQVGLGTLLLDILIYLILQNLRRIYLSYQSRQIGGSKLEILALANGPRTKLLVSTPKWAPDLIRLQRF